MNLSKFHNDVFEHLIKKDIKFKPRVQASERLDKGYWFIGDEKYLNLSFWDGYDTSRKIHRIGFAIDFTGKREVYLNISAKDNKDEEEHLKNVSKAINAVHKYSNLSHKIYGTNVTSSEEFNRLLDQFIETDKPTIDRFINSSPTIKHITLERFNKNISKINLIRDRLGLQSSPIVEPIKATKRIKGRGGVTNKNVGKYIRERLAAQIEIKSIHNELQNQLYKQLDRDFVNQKLVMEENWIDLLQESDGVTYLYEVKPYESATKCIREGVGQLLHYCSQYYSNTKEIKLIIAGPNKLNHLDIEYLRFIQDSIRIKLEYLHIKNK